MRATLRHLRRLLAQRFCKQPQSQPTVAFLDGQKSALKRGAQANVVGARPAVGVSNTQRHGAGGDRAASVHGGFKCAPIEKKRLRQWTQSTQPLATQHKQGMLWCVARGCSCVMARVL